MDTGSLAEAFNYAVENPLELWQPAQVLELQHGGHGVPSARQRGSRKAWGGHRVGRHFSQPMKYGKFPK